VPRTSIRRELPALSTIAILALVGVGSVSACRGRDVAPPKAERRTIWRPVGSWSGHGNAQTESFDGETGTLRVKWETRGETSNAKAATFRLTAHSAISGRILEQVVDHPGAGAGVGYVSQDPHTFYMSVESTGVAWTFTVEEGIAGQVVGGATRR
jgi:hypothetical protein